MGKGLLFFTGKGASVLEGPSYVPRTQRSLGETLGNNDTSGDKTAHIIQSTVLCALQTAFPRIFVTAFWGNYYYYPYPIDKESGA